jgi:hypothetical protein
MLSYGLDLAFKLLFAHFFCVLHGKIICFTGFCQICVTFLYFVYIPYLNYCQISTYLQVIK